jgi:hypothetical protein
VYPNVQNQHLGSQIIPSASDTDASITNYTHKILPGPCKSAGDYGVEMQRLLLPGDSAGFAHLSCLAQYAEQKSKQASDGEMAAFSNPWRYCNNCKQPFENQLSVDLASAFVEFAEATYGRDGNNKYDKMKVMESLRLNIVALLMLNDFSNDVADEKRRIINHLLSMVDQTKKDYKMSRWIHMPKDSEEYQYYRLLCGNYEAFAYDYLGIAAYTNEGAEIAIAHFKGPCHL